MMKTLSPLLRLWRLLKNYKIELRQIYTLAIFIGIVNLTLPLGIQAIINFLQTGELTTTWVILVCIVLVGIAVTGFLQVFQLRIVENMQQDLFARSAFEFAYRIPRISFVQLDRIHAPELTNRFFDTLTLQKGLPKILIDFSISLFQIFFGLILLTVYSPIFVLLGLALAVILYLIFRFTGPQGMVTSIKESSQKYALAHWLEEIARLTRTFKLNAGSDYHMLKTDHLAGKYIGAREKHFSVLLRQFRLFIAFKVIVAAGLLLLGGYLVFAGRLNIGQFVAAEIVIILIINSVEKLLLIIDVIYDVLAALDKIGYVTDLELDTHIGRQELAVDQGVGIQAKDLHFIFPGDQFAALEEVSFKIAAKSKVRVTGESGSGKTILLQVLAGILPYDSGELYLNGIPFRNYKRESVFAHLGMAFPTNQIFEGSIKDNILLGREVPAGRLAYITDLLGMDHFIIHEPKGIDSVVDSGGRRLPRSIIQKILIARIIVHEPKLLLLEDPLQFIAAEEKKMIVDYLTSSERPWTLMVVSDYSYWRERCDQELIIH